MTLSIPEYLSSSGIQDLSLHYEWDDWNDLPFLEDLNKQLIAQLKRISQRAVLAFACGSAEWIVYRFKMLDFDSAPWDFLEAAWAMIVNPRYCGWGSSTGWQEHSIKGWDGPVRRPIKESLKFLEIAFQQLSSEYQSDPTLSAATISGFACHVITDPSKYNAWGDQVLARFQNLYPRVESDLLGDVVPRIAADPASEFSIEQTESLIMQFLNGLDLSKNMFLSPPEGMLQHWEGDKDFQGTPYVFDIEDDRRTRRSGGAGGHQH